MKNRRKENAMTRKVRQLFALVLAFFLIAASVPWSEVQIHASESEITETENYETDPDLSGQSELHAAETEPPILSDNSSGESLDADVQTETPAAVQVSDTETELPENEAAADSVAETEAVQNNISQNTDQMKVSENEGKLRTITRPETHAVAAYRFLDEDDQLLSQQLLSDDEVLKEPAAPSKEHRVFLGWYTAQDVRFTDFGKSAAELNGGQLLQDTEIVLHARYQSIFYVFFKAGNTEDSRVICTRICSDGEEVDTGDVPFASENLNLALVGWSSDPLASEPDEKIVINGDDLVLYPVLKSAHWLTFNSEGGTYIDPVYVLPDDTTREPEAPVRTGYEFGGWLDDSGNPFVFGGSLKENQSLYASWIPAQTSFTVIYWQERLKEGTYDYVEQETRLAETGSAVSADTFGTQKSYRYFHFDVNASDAEVTVSGEGSAVLNIRYARNSYLFDFNLNGSGNFANVSMTIGGTTYRNGSSTHYQFRAVYGEDIADRWPCANHMDGTYSGNFAYWTGGNSSSPFSSKRWNVTSEMISNDTDGAVQQYRGSWSRNLRQVELHYWAQNISGDGYTELEEYRQTANTASGFNAKEIAGFTHVRDDHSGNVYNFYYDRLKYRLEFYNNGAEPEKTVQNIPFGRELSGMEYVPQRPEGVPEYFEFTGWYETPGCLEGSEFVFSEAVMPSANLALYAGWKPKQITVSFDLKLSDSEQKPEEYQDQIIDAGETAARPQDPVREGFTFAGWLKDGEPFHFETVLTADTIITALWAGDMQYSVLYDPNGGITENGEAAEPAADPETYSAGAEVKAADVPDSWLPPESREQFLGWNTLPDGSGEFYYPGDAVQMKTENLVLYAVWTDSRKTVLTFNFNGGVRRDDPEIRSETEVIEVPNEKYQIKNDGSGLVRKGYIFIGWGLQPEVTDSSALLHGGDTIRVDTLNPETNVLYAQWSKLTPPTGLRTELPAAVWMTAAGAAMLLLLLTGSRRERH